jgi:hypothetical protein
VVVVVWLPVVCVMFAGAAVHVVLGWRDRRASRGQAAAMRAVREQLIKVQL